MSDLVNITVVDRWVKMSDLLRFMGYVIEKLPKQIRCPIHNRYENNPSARVYEDDRFLWCYTCYKQFKPTEVFSAWEGITRAEAAERLLIQWPVPSEEFTKLASVSPIEETRKESPYSSYLERRLQEFKRKVPFNLYRDQAKSLDDFLLNLMDLNEDQQQIAVKNQVERMTKAFSSLSS